MRIREDQSSSWAVVPAGEADLVQLADVVARSLADDPMVRWRRQRMTFDELRRHYEFALEDYVTTAVLWRIDGAGATAAWLSPQDAHRLRETRNRARRAPDAVEPDTLSRAVWEWLDSQLPEQPVWFLDLVAVAPELQRSGLGGALVEHGLARARAAGLPAFLETSNKRNLAFYRSHGFHVVAEGTAPPDGPTVWFLQTEPD